MIKTIKLSLEDLRDTTEELRLQVHLMPLKDQVDVAARLRSVVKSLEELDKVIKGEVKNALQHKPGEVSGEDFKALLSLIPTTRLDQKALAEDKPRIFEAYCVKDTQERVDFKPR